MGASRTSLALFLCLLSAGCGGSNEIPAEEFDSGAVDGGVSDAVVDETTGDSVAPDDTLSMPDGTSVLDTAPTDTGPSLCGNSIVDYSVGEECDDGNIVLGDGCDACKREVGVSCGNGALEPGNGEQCDDGNKTAGDGCSATCQLEKVGKTCGNGAIEAPLEVCDDSNTTNGDSCNPTCNLKNTVSTFLTGVGSSPALAADNTGLWMADSSTYRVRRVDIASKSVTNIAGTGANGYLDNAIGAVAIMGPISSITTDGTTIWVADSRRIRAVSATSPYGVSTIAGSGAMGSADGVGPAATFSDPRGLTYFNKKLYLVDAAAPALREIDLATYAVKTIAGNPTATPATVDGCGAAARFVSPRYIASNNSGMLYIADTNGAVVREYNIATGCLSTFAGNGMNGYVDGVGTAAQINRPRGMTSDGTSIYWVEFNQHTLRQAVLATASVTTNAGRHCSGMMTCTGGSTDGIGTAARFNGPWGITYHYASKSLFISETGNSTIRRVQ